MIYSAVVLHEVPQIFESVYWLEPKTKTGGWNPSRFPGLRSTRWDSALASSVLLQARADAAELGKGNHRYFFPDQTRRITPEQTQEQIEGVRIEFLDWLYDPQFDMYCEHVSLDPARIRKQLEELCRAAK